MKISQLMESSKGMRAERFFRENGGDIYTFDRLPNLAKKAILEYTYHNGDIPLDRVKARRYGLVNIPMERMIESIMEDEEIEENFETFEEYHQAYTDGKPMTGYDQVWPVILSDFNDETLQDGWHRFHAYYQRGLKTVPAILIENI